MKLISALFVLLCLSISAFGALTKPKNYLPADNATAQKNSVHLYIQKPSGTSLEFVFQLSTSSSMTNPTTEVVPAGSGSLAHVWMKKLKMNTTYYWRAKTRSATDSSDWTTPWTFTTVNSVSFYFPSSDGRILAPNTYFSWYRMAEYDSFELQLDTSSQFNSGRFSRYNVKDTFSDFYVEKQVNNLYFGERYYCRLRGLTNTDSSAWSTALYGTVFDTTRLRTPVVNERTGTTVEFAWWYGTQLKFQFQLDTTDQFNSPILLDSIGFAEFGTAITLENLRFEQQYYWRVRSISTVDTTRWTGRPFITEGFSDRFAFLESLYPDPRTYIQTPRTIDGITGYEYQVDTNSSFSTSSPEFQRVDTTHNWGWFDSLLYGQLYYVRCRPYNDVYKGSWTKVRTMTIVSAPQPYYPFANYTDINIHDSLTWNIGYNGTTHYQLQLSESDSFNGPLVRDTIMPKTINRLTGLTLKLNQTYYWRMRMWHSRDTSEWSGFTQLGKGQKFTTVSKPTLSRPFNSDFLGTGAETKLEWDSIRHVGRYQILLDTSKEFDSPFLLDTFSSNGTSLLLKELNFGEIYYWKIRGYTANDSTAWSDTWQFFVLNPVRLDRPKNNATGSDIGTLSWRSINGTTGYLIEIDTSPNFTTPIVVNNDTFKNGFFHYFFSDGPFTFNTKYYWRVKVYHAKDSTDWSDVWSFTTKDLVAPDQVYPDSASVDIPLGMSFRWKAYTGAASYIIQYSEQSDFSGAQQFIVAGTSRAVALKPNTEYFWRVTSRNSDGNVFGDWSHVWTFKTKETMDIPVLASPQNGTIDADLTQTLRWDPISGVNYDVQLDDNDAFSSPSAFSTPSSNRTFGGLKGKTTYYWRVRAKNAFTIGDWSSVWNFTTDSDVSVQELSDNGLSIFPNPTSGKITLELTNAVKSSYTILAVTGSVVQSGTFEGSRVILDMSSLDNGFYTLVVDNQLLRVSKSIVLAK